jgi:hypothetical protein
MAFHRFDPLLIPAVTTPLVIALSGWNFWRVKYAYRARGRRAVEQMLKARGETLVAIEDVPFCDLPVKTGLSSTVVFEVRARAADGQDRAYQWAYEPRIFPWQSEGVKRLAHGIWIPAA